MLLMTGKEKRDKGIIYDGNYNEELLNEMKKAKDLCYEYNNIRLSQVEKRKELIKKIFGKTGSNIIVNSNFYCDYGYNIFVGENFYMNHNGVILDGVKVEFGDNVTIGAGSVVTKDIPSNVIAYGNPCKVARRID